MPSHSCQLGLAAAFQNIAKLFDQVPLPLVLLGGTIFQHLGQDLSIIEVLLGDGPRRRRVTLVVGFDVLDGLCGLVDRREPDDSFAGWQRRIAGLPLAR